VHACIYTFQQKTQSSTKRRKVVGVDDLSLLSRTFQARIHEILYIPSFGKPGKPVDLNELTEFHIESLPMLIPNAKPLRYVVSAAGTQRRSGHTCGFAG
jgi:hypothetical protein